MSHLSRPMLVIGAIIAWAQSSIAESNAVRAAPSCLTVAHDDQGHIVRAATSHASPSRTLPPILAAQIDGSVDHDALSWSLLCPRGKMPAGLRLESRRPDGSFLDVLEPLSVVAASCPSGTPAGATCADTGPIRIVVDAVDRSYAPSASHSLLGEVGGALEVVDQGGVLARIPVGGPRESAMGPIDSYRGTLHLHVVRTSRGGAPPVGGTDAGARAVAIAEARTASMLWGQCGITFGRDDEVAVDVVDPPPSFLVAFGCNAGLPSSGGDVALAVDGKEVRAATRVGDEPVRVAESFALAAQKAGFSAVVSPNARISPAALRTADVLIRDADGALATVARIDGQPPTTDATLGVCVGEVNLADGLTHFDDLDAAAGTLEERTLIKAYQDDDPSTIDVFIIPSFSKTGRIGESFIDSDGSAIQNVVLVDRAGIRAGPRSYALAHELGHVLLDMPGHPDDYGVDRPWMLMDADATDGSVLGPRRLSLADCERAIRESGPHATAPLLRPVPLRMAPNQP